MKYRIFFPAGKTCNFQSVVPHRRCCRDDEFNANNCPQRRRRRLHPVQGCKHHLQLIHGSMILDHIRTRFLGGRLKYGVSVSIYMVFPQRDFLHVRQQPTMTKHSGRNVINTVTNNRQKNACLHYTVYLFCKCTERHPCLRDAWEKLCFQFISQR